MSIHRLIFSPTGGTQRAADALTSPWTTDAPLHDIDLTRPDTDCSHLTQALAPVCTTRKPNQLFL